MTPELAVRWRFTSRSDGDLCVDQPAGDLHRLRAEIAPGEWTWLRQVHGADVIEAQLPGSGAGVSADAAVTSSTGVVLAVHTADCAGVLFEGVGVRGPVVGAAHAGWRGLLAGVLQETAAAMRALGAESLRWRLGPCISPEHYEFGQAELAEMERRYGATLRATTASGTPALDLRAGVRAALAEVDAVEVDPTASVPCTSDGEYFSWRTRRDSGRQAAVTWIETV